MGELRDPVHTPHFHRAAVKTVTAFALGCSIVAGCANGESTGEQDPLSGYDDSSDAISSSGAVSGSASGYTRGPSGSPSGSVGSSGTTSSTGLSTGAPSGSGTASPSGSASGTASPGSSAAGSASGASSGAAGSGASGEGGPGCLSNPLNPVSAAASSVEQEADASAGGLVADMAIDKDFSTRWESVFQVDPSWLEVDFGFPVHFSEVDILWQSDCASAYDIDISDDAAIWTTLKSLTTNPVAWQGPPSGWTNDDVEKVSGVGRYIRVHGTKRAQAQHGYSIWEMRVLGDMNASCTP
jgi:cytochrome c